MKTIIKIQNEVFKDLIKISNRQNEYGTGKLSEDYTEDYRMKSQLIDHLTKNWDDENYDSYICTALDCLYSADLGKGIYAFIYAKPDLKKAYDNYEPFIWKMHRIIADTLIALI